MKMIKIELSENNMGDLQINPVNQRILRKCKRKIIEHHKDGSPEMHCDWQREDTEKWLNRGSCVYVQGDWLAEEIYDDLGLTKVERSDVRNWGLVKLVSLDTFDHWFLHFNHMAEEYFLS